MSRSALEKKWLNGNKNQKANHPLIQPVSATNDPMNIPVQQNTPYDVYAMQQYQQQYQQYQQQLQYYYSSVGYNYPPQAATGNVPGTLPGTNYPGIPSGPGTIPQSFVPTTQDDEDILDPDRKKSLLPIHGSTTTFNLNNLLYNNILENSYFRDLYQLRTYHEVIGEIQRSCLHVEPWQTGTSRHPSSSFCLLMKFFVMKLTLKQMNGLLDFDENPFVRAIGFLYLRYTCPPNDLWKWYEPYLDDSEEIKPSADQSISMTIGQYVTKLLTDMQYYGTTFPRIPVPIERKIKVLLLLFQEKIKRRQANRPFHEKGKIVEGLKVKAIYSDDKNEPAWYDAIVEHRDEEQHEKYWVKFPEYGNSECVDLGELDLLNDVKSNTFQPSDRKRSRSRSVSRSRSRERERGYRGRDSRDRHDKRDRSRSSSRGKKMHEKNSKPDDLLARVIQSEREASAAVGRNYGARPTSYKSSLSMKLDRYTVRQKSPSPDSRRNRRRSRSRSRSLSPRNSHKDSKEGKQELSEEQKQKIAKLKAIYGDASSTNNN